MKARYGLSCHWNVPEEIILKERNLIYLFSRVRYRMILVLSSFSLVHRAAFHEKANILSALLSETPTIPPINLKRMRFEN